MAKYEVTIDGETLEVEIVTDDGRNATVLVAGVEYAIEAMNVSAPSSPGAQLPPQTATPPPATKSAPRSSGVAGDVAAPLAGLVLEVCVSVGQEVSPGDVLARLEAMKMENDIKATEAGKVAEILISQGDEVQEGQALLKLEA
jgi:biotin carboxyl carrier protein